MALGFQRIHDVSPLSMKLLNDQLEQLWKKMMGGLETRDMTTTVAAKINSAVTQGQFSSLIEQHAQSIRLAVGSSPSDNLLHNGAGDFGAEGWSATQGKINVELDQEQGNYFAIAKACSVVQSGISLKANTKYTFCCIYRCQDGLQIKIPAASVTGEIRSSKDWQEEKISFTTTVAAVAEIQIEFLGAGDISLLMLSQGDGGTWRQNPNEVKNSSISLSDEQVSIDTRNFALRLYNPEGQVVTEMTADEQGFSKLHIAENMILRGKQFYLGEGIYSLWVHPDADPVGERRIFTTDREPPSLEGCFCDVQEAIDAIPRWCDGQVTVFVYGGAAWQYPSSKLTISHFYGGGSIDLVPWSGVAYTLKKVEVINNSLLVSVYKADINACEPGDCFFVSNSVCWFKYCRVNGRDVLIGVDSAGFDAAYGAQMILTSCQAHRCQLAAEAHMGGRIYMDNCAGSGNKTGCIAATGGLIQQSGTTFAANVTHAELSGGKILVASTSTNAGTTPSVTPMEHVANYEATASATLGGTMSWVTSPDWVQAGPSKVGFLWFDKQALQTTLADKSIVHASITLRRRGEGGRARATEVSLCTCMNRDTIGAIQGVTSYGKLGAWGWGEKKTANVPIQAIADLVGGLSYSIGITSKEEIVFEGVTQGYPTLEIIYR